MENGSVNLIISSDNLNLSEKRFSRHLTVPQLKAKLESITGIPSRQQVLRIDGEVVTEGTLAGLNLGDGSEVQVTSTDPDVTTSLDSLNDTSDPSTKFRLDEESYASRTDSLRSFKRLHGLGRFSTEPAPEPVKRLPEVGSRCSVGSDSRLGTVRFVGETEFGGPGDWIGVELDEPTGKGDGSVQGKRYFACEGPLRAVFVRPDKVVVGDFPPIDILEEEEEM